MRARITRALLAATIAAAGAAAGLSGVSPAGASPAPTPRSPIKSVIDTTFAGYVTGGPWRFRFVSAAVEIANCRATANQNAEAGIALATGVPGQIARIDLRCGGGHDSVKFRAETGTKGEFDLAPGVRDVLSINIYRNQKTCTDTFSATNTHTHNTKTASIRTSCTVVYRHAQFGGTMTDIHGDWVPPVHNARLWALKTTAVTSYNGTRGTICGPWTAQRHLAAPVIAIRMFPSDLINRCRDFSVMLQGHRTTNR